MCNKIPPKLELIYFSYPKVRYKLNDKSTFAGSTSSIKQFSFMLMFLNSLGVAGPNIDTFVDINIKNILWTKEQNRYVTKLESLNK